MRVAADRLQGGLKRSEWPWQLTATGTDEGESGSNDCVCGGESRRRGEGDVMSRSGQKR